MIPNTLPMEYPITLESISETNDSTDPDQIPKTYPFRYITMLDGMGSTMSDTKLGKL